MFMGFCYNDFNYLHAQISEKTRLTQEGVEGDKIITYEHIKFSSNLPIKKTRQLTSVFVDLCFHKHASAVLDNHFQTYKSSGSNTSPAHLADFNIKIFF